MATHTCDDCGDELDSERDTNSAGHYRDRCRGCITRPDDAPPHVETCDADACLVCHDYWQREHSDTIM